MLRLFVAKQRRSKWSVALDDALTEAPRRGEELEDRETASVEQRNEKSIGNSVSRAQFPKPFAESDHTGLTRPESTFLPSSPLWKNRGDGLLVSQTPKNAN